MWWWMHGGTAGDIWWMSIVGLLWMALFWGAVAALVVWTVRRLTGPRDHGGARPSPLDIARERYARGEITREQFEDLRRDLSG